MTPHAMWNLLTMRVWIECVDDDGSRNSLIVPTSYSSRRSREDESSEFVAATYNRMSGMHSEYSTTQVSRSKMKLVGSSVHQKVRYLFAKRGSRLAPRCNRNSCHLISDTGLVVCVSVDPCQETKHKQTPNQTVEVEEFPYRDENVPTREIVL